MWVPIVHINKPWIAYVLVKQHHRKMYKHFDCNQHALNMFDDYMINFSRMYIWNWDVSTKKIKTASDLCKLKYLIKSVNITIVRLPVLPTKNEELHDTATGIFYTSQFVGERAFFNLICQALGHTFLLILFKLIHGGIFIICLIYAGNTATFSLPSFPTWQHIHTKYFHKTFCCKMVKFTKNAFFFQLTYSVCSVTI